MPLVVIPLLFVLLALLVIVGVRERTIAARELSASARAAPGCDLVTTAAAVLAVVVVVGLPVPVRSEVRVVTLPGSAAVAAVVVSALGSTPWRSMGRCGWVHGFECSVWRPQGLWPRQPAMASRWVCL